MASWSQTLCRCTWCQLGWQVMTASSLPSVCLSLSVARFYFVFACRSVCLNSLNHFQDFYFKKSHCLHQKILNCLSHLFFFGLDYNNPEFHFISPPPPYKCEMVSSTQNMLQLNDNLQSCLIHLQNNYKHEIGDLSESTIRDFQDETVFVMKTACFLQNPDTFIHTVLVIYHN